MTRVLSALATNTKVHSASVEVFPGSPESRTNLKLSMRKTEVKTQITNFKIQKLQSCSELQSHIIWQRHFVRSLPRKTPVCLLMQNYGKGQTCRLMLSPIWIHVNMSNVWTAAKWPIYQTHLKYSALTGTVYLGTIIYLNVLSPFNPFY